MEEVVMAKEKGWKSREAANHYQRIADILVPSRKDILSIIARLATVFVSDQPRILDIGCGYGDVTAEIFQLRPRASICMADFPDEMIRTLR